MESKSIGIKCEKCGQDQWIIIDENNLYKKLCTNCLNGIIIKKVDFIKTFQCPECNCLEGTIEENDNLLAVRCKHCGKQTIMLEKHTTENRRNPNAKPSEPMTYEELVNANKPKCPICSSTNIQKITMTKRAVSFSLFGFASSKVGKQWHCNNCKSDF